MSTSDASSGVEDGGQVVQNESEANMDIEVVSQEEEPEEQDTHRCAKCQMEFTSLQDYVQHKMTNHKLKVKFAKSESDRRLLLPKLVQKPGRKPRTGNVSENETSPRPKRVHVLPKKLEDTIMNTNILYICDKCKKSFRREAALKRHLEYDHRERDSSDEDSLQQYIHPNSSMDPGSEDDDPDDSSYKDPNAPKRPGRGRPPKYSNADMSVASMAAILTTMAGGGMKPQVVTITDQNTVQMQEDKDGNDTQQWRPFVCQLCDKRFKEEAVLRAHMLTHSDVREFPCPWEGCKYAFKTKGSLKRHLRRHTNERPYKCNLCDRRFTESGALTRHLKARTACTSKADSDLPRYGKRMQLDERELRRHPHGTMQVVTSATPKLTQISVEDPSDGIPGVVTQEQYVIIEQIPEETQQSEIMETANQDEGQEVENGEIEITNGDEKLCKVCPLTIDNVEALKTHLRGHMENKSFRCTICNTIVDKKEYLDIHMEYVHPEVRKNQKPERAVEISEDQSNVKDSEDHDEEEALDAVVVQEAMLQEGAEIDSSVLESLAGPPGQPQTIVLLSSDGEPQVMEIVRLESDNTEEENAGVQVSLQTNEDITETMTEEGKNYQHVVLAKSKAEESPTTPERKNGNVKNALERNNADDDNKHSYREPIIKVQNFYEITAQHMTPRMFRRFFRMDVDTLRNLVRYMAPLNRQHPSYTRIPLDKKVAMTVAYLGSPSTTLQLSHLFGVAEESFLRITEQIMDCFIQRIHQIIRWPTANEIPLHCRQFDRVGRFFPNTVGAIDDIHLEIKLTDEMNDQDSYFCWKQFHSIHLQNVERSFALLLQRFPRLRLLNQKKLHKKIKTVMTACILHNICILENDNIAYFLRKAQRRNAAQQNQQYRPLGTPQSTQMGTLKHLQLANLVFVN